MSTMELIRMLKNEYDLTVTRNTISDDLSIYMIAGSISNTMNQPKINTIMMVKFTAQRN